jgi:hypothetical protein
MVETGTSHFSRFESSVRCLRSPRRVHRNGRFLFLGVKISVADPKQKFRILFRIRIRPEVSFGSGSGFGSGFESGFESWIRIRIWILDYLDQKLVQFFFVLLKFLRSLIFKDARHQLCDLPTNKVRKKFAIYLRISHILHMHIACV